MTNENNRSILPVLTGTRFQPILSLEARPDWEPLRPPRGNFASFFMRSNSKAKGKREAVIRNEAANRLAQEVLF